MRKKIWIYSFFIVFFINNGIQAQSRKFDFANRPETINSYQELSKKYLERKGGRTTDLDSAYLYCRKAEQLSIKQNSTIGGIRCLLLYSQIHRKKGQHPQGEKLAIKALKLANSYGDFTCIGETHIELSHYFDWGIGLEKKVENLEMALKAFRVKSSRRQLADLLALLADQHFNIGQYSESIKEGKEALAIYDETGKGDLQAVYATLGISHTKLGLYEEGIRYSLLAAETGEKKGDTSPDMMSIYNHIGLSAFYNKDFGMARKYHEKFLELAILNKRYSTIFFAADNIVNDLLKVGKAYEAERFITGISKQYKPIEIEGKLLQSVSLVKVYTALGNFKLASRHCDELLKTKAHSKGIRPAILLNVNQAAVALYFATKRYDMAKYYLEANKMTAEANRDIAYILDSMLWEFKLDSVAKDYAGAIKSQQSYMKLKDSLFNKTRANQIANFHIQYETQKKDIELLKNKKHLELMAKEAQLQQAKIESDRNIKIGAAIALIFTLAIIILLYNRFISNRDKSAKLSLQKKEINDKNQSLLQLVNEKEWLLKEIHHRVKNNLQIIMSLLYAQSEYLDDDAARMAIKNSQSRVQSMALIHQQLYRGDNLSSVYMPGYINELIDSLTEGFDLDGRINFVCDIENIDMDVSQAVPVGIILNEAITNAIKYAYPGTSTGTIKISLLHTQDDIFEVAVRDHGSGITQDLDIDNCQSLGLTLMRGLCSELDGNFRLINDNGVGIYVSFKYYYTTITKTSQP